MVGTAIGTKPPTHALAYINHADGGSGARRRGGVGKPPPLSATVDASRCSPRPVARGCDAVLLPEVKPHFCFLEISALDEVFVMALLLLPVLLTHLTAFS